MAPPPQNNKPVGNERAPPVSLGKPSLKARLEAYYSLTAPDQIADKAAWRQRFDQIWDKFGGTDAGEQKLAAKLAKKYGRAVRLLTASSSLAAAPSTLRKHAATMDNVTQHSEEWYQLNEKERDSQCIDFLSDRFDPVAALLFKNAAVIETTHPWILQSPLLDRVDQFKAYLPPNDPLYRPAMEQRKTERTSKDEPKKKARVPSCFAAMASLHQTGPLSVLYKAFTQRQRVRVVTRYVNGIRGTLTGYLIAFDKHMNLILRDVDENYSPRRVTDRDGDKDELTNVEAEVQRRLRGYLASASSSSPSSSSSSSAYQGGWTNRQRHMRQIMVRGDNVVAVYKAAEEQSAWRPTTPFTHKSPPVVSKYRLVSTQALPPDHQRVGTMASLIHAAQRQQKVPRRGQKRDYRSCSS